MKHIDSALYRYVAPLVRTLMESGAHTAEKIVSPFMVIRATRQAYKGKFSSRTTREEVHVTFGAPNYLARQFIKACVKAGEPFPVRKIRLVHFPVKRKS